VDAQLVARTGERQASFSEVIQSIIWSCANTQFPEPQIMPLLSEDVDLETEFANLVPCGPPLNF
jgi:hypothetical protein